MTSVRSTVSLGLGVVALTDLAEQAFWKATGFSSLHPYLKTALSVAAAAGISYRYESDARARGEMLGVLSGMATVVQTIERAATTAARNHGSVELGARDALAQALPGRQGVQRL